MAIDFSTLKSNIKSQSNIKSTNPYSGKNFKKLQGGKKIKLGDIKIGTKFIDKILEDSPYSTDWVSAFEAAQAESPSLTPDYNYYKSTKAFKKAAKKLGIAEIDTVGELADIFSFAKAAQQKLYGAQASPGELPVTEGYTGLKTSGAPSPSSPGSQKQPLEPKLLDVSGLTDDEGNALGQVKAVEGPTIEELTNQLKVLQDKIDNPTVDPLAKSFTETLKPAKFEQKAQSPYQIKLMSGLGQYFGQKGLRIQSLLNK